MRAAKLLISIVSMYLGIGLHAAMAQDTTHTNKPRESRKELKANEVKKLLDSKHFTFKATYANPLGGGYTMLNGQMFNISPDGTGHIYLNYNFDMVVRTDSVIAYLPFYGRAFNSSVAYTNPNESGIKFTSTKFSYSPKTNKKGITTIVIVPTDAQNINKLILGVSPNGTASLQVISTNRTSISYDGYIAEK
ncbi:DUF4251 domain-containing protein [Mucilaginibacter daejeonensis]|uniref:DUF4251 domain-containing protein n=1 Tax=Mucilaginibacter daejeonensis TaxID=398049 RepID=UPI001D1741C1|nr:DUF4251 domain-containing protein [Mucilaginibacter daejeonensis]UEG55150.1 DUF4251 domain-containing protein [Mucilaginibacter daejeonensis]